MRIIPLSISRKFTCLSRKSVKSLSEKSSSSRLKEVQNVKTSPCQELKQEPEWFFPTSSPNWLWRNIIEMVSFWNWPLCTLIIFWEDFLQNTIAVLPISIQSVLFRTRESDSSWYGIQNFTISLLSMKCWKKKKPHSWSLILRERPCQ